MDTGSIAAGQLAEFRDKDKQIRWVIKKFVGGTELSLRAKISLVSPATGTVRREIGPVSLSFEVPMYNVSSQATHKAKQ